MQDSVAGDDPTPEGPASGPHELVGQASQEAIDELVACAHQLSLVLNSYASAASPMLATSMRDARRELDTLVNVAAATALHPAFGARNDAGAEPEAGPRLRLVR